MALACTQFRTHALGYLSDTVVPLLASCGACVELLVDYERQLLLVCKRLGILTGRPTSDSPT